MAVSYIGGRIEPVVGSGVMPARTTLVSNFNSASPVDGEVRVIQAASLVFLGKEFKQVDFIDHSDDLAILNNDRDVVFFKNLLDLVQGL